MGNLASVRKVLEYIHRECVITDDPAMIAGADALILPGVGAYAPAMKAWEEKQKQPLSEEDIMLNSEREGYDMRASLEARKQDPAKTSSIGRERKDVGFGKARSDLDWIDPRKKFNKE